MTSEATPPDVATPDIFTEKHVTVIMRVVTLLSHLPLSGFLVGLTRRVGGPETKNR
jgi:hypothetical protein